MSEEKRSGKNADPSGAKKGKDEKSTRKTEEAVQGLRKQIALLEKEYDRLSRELAAKKKLRQEGGALLPESGGVRKRLQAMGGEINRTEALVRGQTESVLDLRQFMDRAEKRIEEIMGRVEALSRSQETVGEETTSGLKEDLLGLLKDVRSIRQKREALEKTLGELEIESSGKDG